MTCPTRTPGTSVTAFSVPLGKRPMTMPSSLGAAARAVGGGAAGRAGSEGCAAGGEGLEG
ncbi:hypothetical protein BE15_03660 [Sorangium cellulosum]|uniref:Uncharacterized protein n=1 Tax=Sorangium cellulosum TaxID=56 RepID=A0A150QAG2_SORCE|nr:hypothetical protein BE15_03660 [Sorangium cellulosum]